MSNKPVQNLEQKNLEQKLTRLKEIQQLLESRSVPLSESMGLLEEAFDLKKQIEKELKAMENRLIDLTKIEG
jgi:exodeoxyribonuclease VII small subunit